MIADSATAPLSLLLSLLMAVASAIGRPTFVSVCEIAFHVEAARADGTFQIARPFGCHDERSARGGWDSSCTGEVRACGVLYCTGGTQPIIGSDGCTVGCQRGGYEP